MAESAATADNEFIFGKFAAQVAKNKALVQSWMIGAKERPSRFHKQQSAEDDDEDTETFDLKPDLELAGLGSNISKLSDAEKARLDPELRFEDASVAFLHQQLLGNKNKAAKLTSTSRSGHGLHGVETSFTPSRSKAVSGDVGDLQSQDVATGSKQSLAPADPRNEVDDEDDIGRSGLGSRNAGQSRSNRRRLEIRDDGSSMHPGEPHDDAKLQDEIEGRVDKSSIPKDRNSGTANSLSNSNTRAKKRATSYLDELLAAKSAKQKKRS